MYCLDLNFTPFCMMLDCGSLGWSEEDVSLEAVNRSGILVCLNWYSEELSAIASAWILKKSTISYVLFGALCPPPPLAGFLRRNVLILPSHVWIQCLPVKEL